VREYEENRRAFQEQNALIAKMPVREGFGFEQPILPVAGSSKAAVAAARASPSVASTAAKNGGGGSAKGKRRKTPEYTDSEDESE
jgi:chromodomain-helicase-DNA-binding protein 1